MMPLREYLIQGVNDCWRLTMLFQHLFGLLDPHRRKASALHLEFREVFVASYKSGEEVEILVCEQGIFENKSVKASLPIFESVEDLLTPSI